MFAAALIASALSGQSQIIILGGVGVPIPQCSVSVGQVQTQDPYGVAPAYCGGVRLEPDTVIPQ